MHLKRDLVVAELPATAALELVGGLSIGAAASIVATAFQTATAAVVAAAAAAAAAVVAANVGAGVVLADTTEK